jgi:hypothetical protein
VLPRLVTVLTLVITASLLPLVAPAPLSLPTATAGCSQARKWKPRAQPRFGVSLSTSPVVDLGDDLRVEQRRFGTRVPVLRTWDNGVPDTATVRNRGEWFGRRWLVTSLKLAPQDVLSGAYDARLRAYFRALPRRAPIFWSYFHEPEDDIAGGSFTAAQYRDAFRHVAGIAAAQCRRNLYPTLILMGWTADPGSHRSWRDYYPGRRYVSVLGWDPYNGAEGYAASYRTPRDIAGAVIRVSHHAGKPFGIAETGSVRIAGDADGAGRAAWLRGLARYLRRKNAAFVTYFQSTNKGDFELRDRAGVRAWRSAMD